MKIYLFFRWIFEWCYDLVLDEVLITSMVVLGGVSMILLFFLPHDDTNKNHKITLSCTKVPKDILKCTKVTPDDDDGLYGVPMIVPMGGGEE